MGSRDLSQTFREAHTDVSGRLRVGLGPEQPVTSSPDRLDQWRQPLAVDLSAQVADVDVIRTRWLEAGRGARNRDHDPMIEEVP